VDVRTLWTELQRQTVHLKIVVFVFLGLGITNFVFVGSYGVLALLFFLTGSSKTAGAGPFFGGLLMLVFSIPLAFASILYLLCGFGVIYRSKVARYGAMALCFLLTPFAWDLVYTISPRYSQELSETVFGWSMYLFWALIWRWEQDRPYNLSLM
jgi:hypothetical protein